MNRLPALIGAAIFVVALLFRLVGIGWGLKNDLHNQSYHPDELENFLVAQQIEPAKGNFLPHHYNYGTLYFTLVRVTSDVVTGYTGGPDKSEDSNWDWISRCTKAGRIVGAAFGAGTALLLYGMMRRFTSLLGATLAGAVIAIAPAHVVHSRFLTVDVFALFFIAASAYAALRLIPAAEGEPPAEVDERLDQKLGLKFAALSGLFAGLSAGVKYTGILALFTLYAAVVLAKRKRWILESVVATAVAGIAFVVSTPGCLFDQEAFLRDVKFEMNHVATGHGLAFVDTSIGFVYHTSNLFLGLGAILTLVCLAGLTWAATKRQLWCLALLAFFIPYFVLIGREEVKFLRYTFPLYVALAAGFGWAMAEMHRRGGLARLGVAIGICGLGGLDFGGLRSAATLTAQMAFEDPRDRAVRYIRSIETPATRVGLAREIWYWSVPLMPDNDLPPSVAMDKRIQEMHTTAKPPVDIVLNPVDGSPVAFSPKLITDLRPELIVFTSIEAGDLTRLRDAKGLNPGDQSMVNDTAKFMDVLPKYYKPYGVFGTGGLPVEDMEYINPQVYIWKRIGTP
jgi:hypothetical protein